MRERINRLANGFIENEVPNIKAEPETIEEELITGQWQGSFRIFSENHVQMKGLVYSDNPHVKVLRRQFKGYEATIGYQLKLHHKEEAEDISGRFVIVGNGCEREVPFHFLLSGARKVRTEARFETIEEFAAFVQEEKEAGGRLFNSPHFEKQPFMQNLSCRPCMKDF